MSSFEKSNIGPQITAEFFRTYVENTKLPESPVPEVAFIGRSNAGKSSLLNALLQKKDLARTSRTPGRTQAMNYFSVEWREADAKDAEPNICFFVDFPGYGYAKVSRSLRNQFQSFIESYIFDRKQVAGVVLVCDSRRGPEQEEEYVAYVRRDVPLFLALTKADKLSGNERAQAKKRWSALKPEPRGIYFCSVSGKNAFQLPELRSDVLRLCSLPLEESA